LGAPSKANRAVSADDGARCTSTRRPSARPPAGHARAQHAVLADLHVGAHVPERADAHARTEAAPVSITAAVHRRRRVDARVRGDDGARVDAWTSGGRVEQQEQVDHRLLGRGDLRIGAGSPVTPAPATKAPAREACAAAR